MKTLNLEILKQRYDRILLVDFEFAQTDGNLPSPICVCVQNYVTGEHLQVWLNKEEPLASPFKTKAGDLMICFSATAELNCLRTLGWPIPAVIDIYVEYLNFTNGLPVNGKSLIHVLQAFGLPSIGFEEKESMRTLAMRGEPFSEEERIGLLNYCSSDVKALALLFRNMVEKLDVDRALFRGEYMSAVSAIECFGTPLDAAKLRTMIANLPAIKHKIAADVNRSFNVFDGTTFKRENFEKVLSERNIIWPLTDSGTIALDDDTFRDMCKTYPEFNLIREARQILSKTRLSKISIGSDGRNRCALFPFASRTGRNQPSNSKFIFGPSSSLRSLIVPREGTALIYLDFSQQEYGIAAALSKDEKMMTAYSSGDPYLQFAKDSGMIAKSALKNETKKVRDLAKQCILAIQYGMGARTLATRISKSVIEAEHLLGLHRRTYPGFWSWQDQVENLALLHGRITTNLGWHLHCREGFNRRSIRNFPMQANGAEILRVALVLLNREGIRVCAPIHDAVLIESDIELLERTKGRAKDILSDASSIILGGFRLRSDEKTILFPDRYEDERGIEFWRMLEHLNSEHLKENEMCTVAQPVCEREQVPVED